MKHNGTHRITSSSSRAPGRAVGKTHRPKAGCPAIQPNHSGESIEHCYRTLLETSNSAILLLSSESIILGWNRAAERLSGWITDEALGRSYAELCLPMDARELFLCTLAQATAGSAIRDFKSPLQTRSGAQRTISWNISPVLGGCGSLIGLMAIGQAVTPHSDAEETLQLAHVRLREEARRTQMATEEERRRIARELHDEFGQALTGLKFDLAWLGMKLTPSLPPSTIMDLRKRIRTMSGSVDSLLESVRATARSLRPAMLDDLGFVPALKALATTFRQHTGARCALDIAPELSPSKLPTEITTALFRIAQELLTNIMRHAAASQVHIRLYQDNDTVTLEVTDNGTGITRERMTTPQSFGIRGMQERASLLGGHFSIAGTSGVGTTACASIPVTPCRVQ